MLMETCDPCHATVCSVSVGNEVKCMRQVDGQRQNVRAIAHVECGLILAVEPFDRKFARLMESIDAGRNVTLCGGMEPAFEFRGGCSA